MDQLNSALLISIIMPVRNGMPFLPEAVESFLSQDWPHKQLVVVDGLSTDGTSAFLDACPSSQITRLSESDQSATQALNKGVARAHGDVIGLLMSDDWLEPGALRVVAEAFLADRNLQIVAGMAKVTDVSRVVLEIIEAPAKPLTLTRLLGTPYAAAFFFRARTWRLLKGFDEGYRFGADRDFLMRARLSGAAAACVPDLLYAYRSHEGSDTLGNNEEVVIAFLGDHLRMVKNWLSHAKSEDQKELRRWKKDEAVALLRLYVKHRRHYSAALLLGKLVTSDPKAALEGLYVAIRPALGRARRLIKP